MAREDKDVKVKEKAAPAEAAPVFASKADEVRASKLPQHKKDEYLARLAGEKAAANNEEQITLDVYLAVAGIKPGHKKAMLVYPKAKGVQKATLAEWKEIFKGF